MNWAAMREPDSSGAPHHYRSVAFPFARALRYHPRLVDLDADAAEDLIEPVLELLAADDGPWVLVGYEDICGNPQDAEQDFLLVWDRLLPAALGVALRRSQEPRWDDPTCLGPELSAPRRTMFRAFVALAFELARVSVERGGDDAVPLPVHTLADLLGTTAKPAGWRDVAVRRGIIFKVANADRRAGRAAEYRPVWIGGAE